MYITENFRKDTFIPARFESDGVVQLHGQKVSYHTISEDNLFYDENGNPIASIFSYSYFRKDVKDPSVRPVIFAYNGGPGCSSMYVHAGFLGPRRIRYGEVDRPSAFGPYEVVDNPDCLLDAADLVLIDPVGTGYGALFNKDHEKDFLGIEPDAEALLNFIECWTRRYNRALSPKYLVGESYGCTRNAIAAGIAASGGKEKNYGIAFDGIVNIGNTITTGHYFAENLPVEPSVIGFPTYAAVNWYHHHPTDQTVEEFVQEAKNFADTEYLLALYQGESLNADARKRITDKVSYYTGASEEYLNRYGLKIDDDTYRQEVCRKEGKAVGRCDGRITRPLLEPSVDEEKKALMDDPTGDRYDAYFYAALTGDILPKLGIRLDRNYIASTGYWKTWNKEESMGTTAEQLRNAMTRRPGTRVFFANGWYDLCTEFGYVWHTLNHAGLPKDRVTVKGYKSGHMIYLGEENVHELSEDIRDFIQGGMPGTQTGFQQ